MDPHGVRAVGGGFGPIASRARVVARELDELRLPETGDGLGLGPDVAPVLAVWADGIQALGTELRLLEQRCTQSARGVEEEDERARHRFAQHAASRPAPGRA